MHQFDPDTRRASPSLPDVSIVISLAPLTAIQDVLDLFQTCSSLKRVVAFGTTGIFTKVDSTSGEERNFVQDQLRSEQILASWSESRGIGWTLLRPTMIYGVNEDRNVTFIRSMLNRFGFFPLPFGARGVRQPVHADDLALACRQVIETPVTLNRAYNVGGGEVLLYEDMVRRICVAEGRSPRLAPIPLSVYYLLILLARRLLGQSHLRKEMVDRMYADLVTDNTAAHDDFGYQPRRFEPPGR